MDQPTLSKVQNQLGVVRPSSKPLVQWFESDAAHASKELRRRMKRTPAEQSGHGIRQYKLIRWSPSSGTEPAAHVKTEGKSERVMPGSRRGYAVVVASSVHVQGKSLLIRSRRMPTVSM
jgi:hypothetical protein